LEQGLHKSKEDEGVLTKVKMEVEIDEKAEPELGVFELGLGEMSSSIRWDGLGMEHVKGAASFIA
jgi:hypothetical protein